MKVVKIVTLIAAILTAMAGCTPTETTVGNEGGNGTNAAPAGDPEVKDPSQDDQPVTAGQNENPRNTPPSEEVGPQDSTQEVQQSQGDQPASAQQNPQEDEQACSQMTLTQRDCPSDACNGENWEDYPNDGTDTCLSGVVTQYPCVRLSSAYDVACDTDDDNDGILDGRDSHPLDNHRCSDYDNDGCEDCLSGLWDDLKDGPDADFDGICDIGDATLEWVATKVDDVNLSGSRSKGLKLVLDNQARSHIAYFDGNSAGMFYGGSGNPNSVLKVAASGSNSSFPEWSVGSAATVSAEIADGQLAFQVLDSGTKLLTCLDGPNTDPNRARLKVLTNSVTSTPNQWSENVVLNYSNSYIPQIMADGVQFDGESSTFRLFMNSDAQIFLFGLGRNGDGNFVSSSDMVYATNVSGNFVESGAGNLSRHLSQHMFIDWNKKVHFIDASRNSELTYSTNGAVGSNDWESANLLSLSQTLPGNPLANVNADNDTLAFAVDSDGVIHLVFEDKSSGAVEYLRAQIDFGAFSWSFERTPIGRVSSIGSLTQTQIAVDANGALHIAYADNGSLWYATNKSHSAAFNLFPISASKDSPIDVTEIEELALVVGADGIPHIAFSKDRTVGYIQPNYH